MHQSRDSLQTTLMKVRIQESPGRGGAKPLLQRNNWHAPDLKVSGDKFSGSQNMEMTDSIPDAKLLSVLQTCWDDESQSMLESVTDFSFNRSAQGCDTDPELY